VENQFERFLSKDNFTLAYLRIKTTQRNPYKDFFYRDFRAFELFFDENIDQLILEVSEGIYTPSNCEKYYMPKKRNLARPITMLTLIDQIVYQALANIIADIFHPLMSRYFNLNTFGNMFIRSDAKNHIFFYEKWKTQWEKFNKQKEQAYNKGYKYCMGFDIASFYDSIDHNILLSILQNNSIHEKLIDLLQKCLGIWTTSSTQNLYYKKSSGIPQGPVSSPFFSEIYLFMLDKEVRKNKNIKYFRYSDDIDIMARTEEECQKMIVYLDLLARDLTLIPQSEKIEITCIENIKKHLYNTTSRFSRITHEYKQNNSALKMSTHNKLKKQFIHTINTCKYDKTIIRFALFKLNKDNKIKETIIKHIKKLELFYDEIIFYFSSHFPDDKNFKQYISNYLLGDIVLFQYNKSLIFKNFKQLHFDETIYKNNIKDNKYFWIVQYYMIDWLIRCNRPSLAIESYKGLNYYILREISYIKADFLEDETAKRQFIESMINDPNPMLSLHGLLLWNTYLPLETFPDITGKCNYAIRILTGKRKNLLIHLVNALYSLDIPQKFLDLISKDQSIHIEAKENIQDFNNYKEINPSLSLMHLDLLHNIIFDVIAKDKGYSEGDFGGNLPQMKDDFPLAYNAFKNIHDKRNQRSIAHYKDRNGNPRIKISNAEYEHLLKIANLREAYDEIFQYYNDSLP
jgi:hypothetical protein